MSHLKNFTLVFAFCFAFITPAQATTIALNGNGQWHEFNVDDFLSATQGVEWVDINDSNAISFGSALAFEFSIANGFKGLFSVVDAGFAGDRFTVFNQGIELGTTSESNNANDYSNIFSANLTNNHFSRGVFSFDAGDYRLTGSLLSSLQNFNATNGAVKLDITPVPSPNTLALLALGLGLLTFRRRHA